MPSVESAFRPNAEGIYVPAEQSRDREVWTTDETRLVKRVTRLLASRGLAVFFKCKNPRCDTVKIEASRLPDGSKQLQCACKNRIFSR